MVYRNWTKIKHHYQECFAIMAKCTKYSSNHLTKDYKFYMLAVFL